MIGWRIDRRGLDGLARRQLDQARRPEALLAIWGRELVNRLKAHFRAKDRQGPNRLSPRRAHYWLGVSRMVQSPQLRGMKSVSVTVAHPSIAQKVFGGPIVAKRARALTIPVSEEAYGRTASTFEAETGRQLFLLRSEARLFLASRVGGTTRAEYLLTPRVDQEPEPDALPDVGMLQRALVERGRKYLERTGEG